MPRNDQQLHLRWDTGALELNFTWTDATPVVLDSWKETRTGPGAPAAGDPADTAPPSSEGIWGPTQPLAEVLVLGLGREWNNTRLTHTVLGAALRHVSHTASRVDGAHCLRIEQESTDPHLRVTTLLRADEGGKGVQVRTLVENLGSTVIHLEAVSSFALGCLVAPGSTMEDLDVTSGCSAHLAENRWSTRPLVGPGGLARIHSHRHANQCGRGTFAATGYSTWTTDGDLPGGVVSDRRSGRAVAWQVESDGPWRWELDARRDGGDSVSLVLSGPDDRHHAAQREVVPGHTFETVPASVAFSQSGSDGALAALTRHRRWLRAGGPALDVPVVYNDYMNTLDGDPSQEVDLALARAAAAVGVDVFCVDAGWYADPGVNWWASVGDWEMSTQRFPAGVEGWCREVRALGLNPGIWMEPGVVGVGSRAAVDLPDSAFLTRCGVRVREQDRYILDFRDPHARAHVDGAVDRLVAAGIGYFKFDDNVTPGLGGDAGDVAPGAGLLDHVRTQLAWLGDLRGRHPEVVIENCSSGAMRSDFARLAVLDLQSTSDQQDPLLYPVIAASSPMLMPPEVAANWAYPQPDMSLEQIAFTMVTGLSGTPYLAGFLDRMSDVQLALVREAVDVHRMIRDDVEESVPFWPLGLPRWEDSVVVLGLHGPSRDVLLVWDRSGVDHIDIDLGVEAQEVRALYPIGLPAWGIEDVEEAPGTVRLRPVRPGIGDVGSARVLEVRHR